jgi:PAS domain S-box-containing protein
MKNTKNKIPTAVMQSGEEKFTWIKDIRELSIGELVELYAYAEAIVETVREPLIILDNELRVRSVNRAFSKTFRTSNKDTYGKFIYDINSGDWDIPALRKLLNEILPKNAQFNDFEVDHDFGSIGHKTMLLNARRIILEENKTELILLAIEDVTEKKILEKQKEEFINIASHELKTPITAIKILVEILLRQSKNIDDKHKKIMHSLNQQTDRLTEMVNRLLTIGRIEEGNATLIKKKVDLDAMLKRVVEDFQLTLKKHTLVITGESKKKILLDEASIEQLLVNLLTNAVKYSPDEGKIIITVSKNKNEVVVNVKDTGIGIAKKELSQIFDRYYRSATSSNAKGFGLGLYISEEIVKQHNGRIWAESVKGKGSTFFFTLPTK